jgi:hemolysin III
MNFLMSCFQFREPISAWSHCLWLVLSVPATMILLRRCEGDRSRQVSLLVFGVSLTICYAGSTLFHGVRLSPEWIARFDQLDHIGIFILIAGSYTPVAWNLLHGYLRWGTLVAAWSCTLVGTAVLLSWGVFTMFWSTCFYVGMGWAAVICYIEMSRVWPQRTLFPLLLGGILYTVGAVINLMEWPEIQPGVFGPHEVFHLFVMAGSLAHFQFMHDVIAIGGRNARAAAWRRTPADLGLLNSMAPAPDVH